MTDCILFDGKTLWDLLDLLIVPIVLVFIAYFLNKQRSKAEQQLELERNREARLQSYLETMSNLFLQYQLKSSDPDSELQGLARAHTLTVLSELDGTRKGRLIRFLYQMGAISKKGRIIDLSGADLNGVELSGSDISGNRTRTFLSYLDLSKVQFFGVNMIGANLADAKLSDAGFAFADLSRANLERAHLMLADLKYSTLSGANLKDANLFRADLTGVIGLTKGQLSKTATIEEAKLPDGM